MHTTLQNAMSNPYSSLVYGRTTLVSFAPVGITPDDDDDVLSAMPMARPISAVRPVLWGAYAVAEMLYVGPLVVEVLPMVLAFCKAL